MNEAFANLGRRQSHCGVCFKPGHNLWSCTEHGAEEARAKRLALGKRRPGTIRRSPLAKPVQAPETLDERARLRERIDALSQEIDEYEHVVGELAVRLRQDYVELEVAVARLKELRSATATPTSALEPGESGVLDVEDPKHDEDRHEP